jgi:hypothetical protein
MGIDSMASANATTHCRTRPYGNAASGNMAPTSKTPSNDPTVPDATGLSPNPNPFANNTANRLFFSVESIQAELTPTSTSPQETIPK